MYLKSQTGRTLAAKRWGTFQTGLKPEAQALFASRCSTVASRVQMVSSSEACSTSLRLG